MLLKVISAIAAVAVLVLTVYITTKGLAGPKPTTPTSSPHLLTPEDNARIDQAVNYFSRVESQVPLQEVSDIQSSARMQQYCSRDEVSRSNLNIIQYTSNGKMVFNLADSGRGIDLEPNQKIVVIVHGFLSSGANQWVQDMAHAYHRIGITNTLAVDWRKPARSCYLGAVYNLKEVAGLVADWLYSEVLHNNPGSLGNLHLIGHSLGAHLVGFMGKSFKVLTGNVRVGRITGLDAAGPLFNFPIDQPPADRFAKDDAVQTEAYHTNVGFFGFQTDIANQDFYINYGGPIQPVCYNAIFKLACSHSYATQLYTKTIESTDYTALACGDKIFAWAGLCKYNLRVIMGEHNNGTYLGGSFYANIDASGFPK